LVLILIEDHDISMMEDMQPVPQASRKPAPQASPTIQNPAPQASRTVQIQNPAPRSAHVQPVAENEMEVDASRGTKRTSKVVLESDKKKKVANDEGGLLLLAAVSVASPPNAACNNTVNRTLDINQAKITSNDPKEGSVEYLLHEFGSTLDNIIGDSPLHSTDPTRIIAGVASTAVEEALSTNKVAAPKSTTGTKMNVTKRDKTVKAAKPEPMVLRKGTKK
jgi:hypothetical protein